MDRPDHYVYLLQQRVYEEPNDHKGRLSILGCYNSLQVANAAAKVEIIRLDVSEESAARQLEDFDGLLLDTTVYTADPDVDRVDIFVEKILCAPRFDGIINGDNYIPLEDEVEEVAENDETEEIEILDDDTLPATSRSSLSASKNSLVGLTFAFTGSLPKLSREDAEMLVYRCGGSVVAQPTKATSYVVLGANPAQTRLRKIQVLGIKTISEKDLCHMATGIAKSIERGGMQDEEVDDLTVVSSPSTPRQSSIAATVGTAELDPASSSTAHKSMSGLIPKSPQGNLNRKRGREEGIEGEDFKEDQPSPKRQKDLHSSETEIIAGSFEFTQSPMKTQEEQQVSEQCIVVKSIEEEKPAVTEQEGQQLPEQEFLVGSIQAGQLSAIEQEAKQSPEKEIVADSGREGKLPLKEPEERPVPETEVATGIAGEGQPPPKAQEELPMPEKQVTTGHAITEVIE